MKAKFLMCLAATMVSLTTLAADQKLTVGFSQIGAESGWRTANTIPSNRKRTSAA